jgi:hypothetical protein
MSIYPQITPIAQIKKKQGKRQIGSVEIHCLIAIAFIAITVIDWDSLRNLRSRRMLVFK